MAGEIFEKQTGKYDPRTMILTLKEYEKVILELEPFASGMITTETVNNNCFREVLEKFVDLAKQIKEKK